MSAQEKRLSDLTPFEAALAGLAPRVEGFDRERLIFLAGQAAALRGAGVSPAEVHAGGTPGGYSAGGTPAEVHAGGTPAPQWRWAWPAAFSAMTVVAASLLVMLCTRAGPTVVTAGVGPKSTANHVAGTPRAPAEDGRRAPDASTDTMPDWLAPWLSPWTSPVRSVENVAEAADATLPEPDPALRAEMRRHGIDFRRPHAPASSGAIVVAEGPLPYYELLHRLQGKSPAGQGG